MRKLSIFVLVLAALLLIGALTSYFMSPSKEIIRRYVQIHAPYQDIYQNIALFKNQDKWLPLRLKDKSLSYEIIGDDGKVGSIYRWQGDPNITGQGEMKMLTMSKNVINMSMNFVAPYPTNAKIRYEIDDLDEDDCFDVYWTFEKSLSFTERLFFPFMKLEQYLGNDYQNGLNQLKLMTETEFERIKGLEQRYPVKDSSFGPHKFVGVSDSISMDSLGKFFENAYPNIMAQMGQNKIEMYGGFPSAAYYTWDDSTRITKLAALVPVKSFGKLKDSLEVFEFPKSKALEIDYYGNYDKLGDAHEAMAVYCKKNQINCKMPCFEIYVSDPMAEADTSKWLTKVIYLH